MTDFHKPQGSFFLSDSNLVTAAADLVGKACLIMLQSEAAKDIFSGTFAGVAQGYYLFNFYIILLSFYFSEPSRILHPYIS